MRLYLLQRKDDVGYDEMNAFVIKATDAKEARCLASFESKDEGKDVWLNTKKSKCIGIKSRGLARIILSDFNAG